LVKVGFASVAPLPHQAFLERWVHLGLSAGMSFFQRNLDRRGDPRALLPQARSAIVVAASYAVPGDSTTGSGSPHGVGLVARYARGRDYHVVLRERLLALGRRIAEEVGGTPGFRVAVDTSPLLERELAMAAGVGFIAKNTLLITPGIGSYTVLGTLLTSVELPPDPPSRPRCGTCTLCMDACPTKALREPYLLDTRRCISYLTIEERGEIAPARRAQLAPWVFGCDVCQQVCPYNVRAGSRHPPDPDLTSSRAGELQLPFLLRLRSGQYRRLVRGRALSRISRPMLIRNAALTAGASPNREDEEIVRCVERAARHDHPLVREACRWAQKQR